MRKNRKISMATQRSAAIRQRNALRKFYEFQKNSVVKNRPKKSRNKYRVNRNEYQEIEYIFLCLCSTFSIICIKVYEKVSQLWKDLITKGIQTRGKRF
jgi:hypothetical protein